MSTTYDFLVQPAELGAPFDLEGLEAALRDAGVTQRPDGGWTWTFPAGDVVGLVVKENGAPVAFELRVPLKDSTTLVSSVLSAGLRLCEAGGLRLLDPQLNQVLRLEAEGAVAEAYLRHARYAGEYLGVSDALGASTLAQPVADKTSPGVVVTLVLIVFGVALWLTYRALSF